jgi:hypothetical protein
MQTEVGHQPFNGAASDVSIFAVELRPHFGCAADTEVLAVNPFDHRPQLTVANSSCRRASLLGCPVRTWGELQRSADRLDPESFSVSIDLGDHFLVRPSSSVAKRIDADFKIGFRHLVRSTKLLDLTLEFFHTLAFITRESRPIVKTRYRLFESRSVTTRDGTPSFSPISLTVFHCDG